MKPTLLLANFLRRQTSLVIPVTIALTFAGQPAQAVSLFWDGTDTTLDADGGAGTWDLNTTGNWDTAATAGTDSVWSDATGTADTASFGGAAGTVTLNSTLGAPGLVY